MTRSDATPNAGRHIALLGDSVFDNSAYVQPGEPDVAAQVRAARPGAACDLLAIDGSVTEEVFAQAEQLATGGEGLTHIVLSSGGNDALGLTDWLMKPSVEPTEFLAALHAAQQRFRAAYLRLVKRLQSFGRPLLIATVYRPAFPDAPMQAAAEAGLSLFNDVILSLGSECDVPVLEMRRVCVRPEHFANPIEPSAAGGDRIAAAIHGALDGMEAAPGFAIYPTMPI